MKQLLCTILLCAACSAQQSYHQHGWRKVPCHKPGWYNCVETTDPNLLAPRAQRPQPYVNLVAAKAFLVLTSKICTPFPYVSYATTGMWERVNNMPPCTDGIISRLFVDVVQARKTWLGDPNPENTREMVRVADKLEVALREQGEII